MYEFLTLAIRETNPRKESCDFEIVAMYMKTKEIYSFNLRKDDIISNSGQVFWDIGYFTTVSDVEKINGRLVPTGFIKIEDASSKLKTILEAKTINYINFLSNDSIKYAIVKISKIEDICIEEKSDIFQSRILVKLMNYNVREKLLNKDYRWVKYWKHIDACGNFEEKKNQYIKLFNNSKKTLYLLLYRHTFADNTNFWIAGMHWL